MEALVIHAPGDLRVEEFETAELGAGQLQVRVRCGGICGSDLHYYQHGGFGTIRIKEPMVLGHEVAGVIEAVGAGVQRLCPGRARGDQPEPAVRAVPLLPAGAAEPLPGHALLRQRHAHPPRAGGVSPADRGGDAPGVPAGGLGGRRRGLDGRATVGCAARGAPRRIAAWQARPGDGLRADRGAGHHRRAARRRQPHRGAPTSARIRWARP